MGIRIKHKKFYDDFIYQEAIVSYIVHVAFSRRAQAGLKATVSGMIRRQALHPGNRRYGFYPFYKFIKKEEKERPAVGMSGV